jgi:nifR3 family TIM-barrel protein
MGCPVPKVAVRAQAGSALLKSPDKVYEIVKAVVEAVPVPVTVKIRSGWDENSINAVEIAKIVEKAGASAITVHPRTRAQGYSGKANWDIIRQVKENVNIPVIGNGDIKTCYDAKRMIDETKCDAVMIGRGVLGNPWLIKEIIDYLKDGTIPTPISPYEKIEMIKKHLKLLKETKNDKLALLEIRGHATWYLKGIPNSSNLRNDICHVKTIDELLIILDEFKKRLDNES